MTRPDANRLHGFFTDLECPHIAALVTLLASPEMAEFAVFSHGTSTSFSQIVAEFARLERVRQLPPFFSLSGGHLMGSRDGSVTPLDWVDKVAGVFEYLAPDKQQAFNNLCGGIVETLNRTFVDDGLEPISLIRKQA